MPEIWLGYGTTHVVLDIKIENLAGHVSSKFQPMPEGQLKVELQNVSLTDDMLIVALTGSKATANVISHLVGMARTKGISNITVDVPTSAASALRRGLGDTQDKESKVPLNKLENGFPVLERSKKFKTVITVSQVGIDPLFGFCGAPTFLLRYFLLDKMADAFAARKTEGPKPSEETEALRIATSSAAEALSGTAIEIVANSSGIGGVHIGELPDAFLRAISNLRTISSAEVETTASLVASSSADPYGHATLSSSLNSLWNCIGSGMLKQGGRAILVCECRDGVGPGALQKYIEGRLNDDEINKGGYIEGLEHLVYLSQMKEKFELALVSTLPKYYTSAKLGFLGYSSMRDVVTALIAKQGKSAKSIVISDPDILVIKRKPQS